MCFCRSALVPRNLPCPEKSLVARLFVSAYSTFLVWTFQESICGENKVLTNFQVRKRRFTLKWQYATDALLQVFQKVSE